MEPKYKEGDEVYYFDSFVGAIVGTTIKSYHDASYSVQTPRGGIIARKVFVGKYELSNGVIINEYFLFTDPTSLINHYLHLFEEFKKNRFDGIY